MRNKMCGQITWVMLILCCIFHTRTRGLDSDKHKCGAIHGHRMRRHAHELFPRQPPIGNRHGYALQFETGQVILYPKLRSPTKKFSVDFWMKPEGGQQNPAVILKAYDKCAPENEARGWYIGLRENARTSDLRIIFTVHSASADSSKVIKSHSKIEPRRWYHVAATYDGLRTKLYVNQAKVAVGYGQKGVIFDSATRSLACDQLEVGGDVKRGLYYRGEIDKLRLWNVALSHRTITRNLPENSLDGSVDKIVMYDDFNKNNSEKTSWILVTDEYPRFVHSTVPGHKHDLSIRKPPCGKTICDNPEMIRSYLRHPGSRTSKRLRIRFINVMNDDGTKAMLQDSEIFSQFKLMQSAFSVHNITWEMQIKPVRNSWLRNKIVLHSVGCEVRMIGNRACEDPCDLEITGWDGGDCRQTECLPQKTHNGICNPECNTIKYKYDGGDCCISSLSKACVDPNSHNRIYVSIDEYKKAVGITNRDALNVYVVNWSDDNLQGTSIFPWEKTVHTELGGVVLPPKNFGTTKVLIHEIGHILGLWHVHHGSTTEMLCSDDCFESFPSLELGDLCSDTKPTVKHTTCADPVVTSETTCGQPPYTDTPYTNYMGYANDSCTNNFTPQQVARMHCYIDLDYQSWQSNPKPSFIPLSPRITEAKKDKIKLSWLPPLGPGGKNAVNLCNECDEKYILEQYATSAYSSIKSRHDRQPDQAVGQPDAEHCNPSPYSWQPSEYVKLDCPECKLYLELGFKEPVVPNEITIWVPYSGEQSHAFSNIVLIYVDDSSESIGSGTVQCDSPYTKQLYVKKKVASVRIFVTHQSVCIDAVKLTSRIGHPNCMKCKPLHYVIKRDPPFDTGSERRVATAHFEDKNIHMKGPFEYKVRAVTNEGLTGPFSPTLIYEAKRGFCGDGKIDKGENCDDGNIRDGDGCNIQCQMEDVFRCDGRPSLCYRHDGDGVCEEVEKRTSIRDCGFFTPDGFRDQWVYRVNVNPKYKYDCEPTSVIGPPRSDLKCESGSYADSPHFECVDGWTPSNEAGDMLLMLAFDQTATKQDHWLNVYFKHPAIASALVVYIASIYLSELVHIEAPPLIKFELHGASPNEKTLLEYRVTNYCNEYPITIPIQHDMTKPFFKTRYVKMKFGTKVKISAVSLRSPKYFDPVGLQHCTGPRLFHPSTQKCENYKCEMPTCSKLMLKYSRQIRKKCKKGSLEGKTCTVQCVKGFTPVAPFEVICSGGQWLVDGKIPKCTPVDCGKPAIPNAVPYCPDGTTFGKKCSFKCDEGTKQIGNGGDLFVTCEADGIWSAITTFCRRTCLLPPTPAHSRLVSSMNKCSKAKTFISGEKCRYRCKPGYKPSGHYNDESRKNDFFQMCLKGGSWTRKRCVRITCPVEDPNIFRWYNCTLGNLFGSVCRLACPDEKVPEIKCNADGKWDKKLQLCSKKGSCPPPVNVNSDDFTISCGSNLGVMAECQITCAKGLKPIKVKGNSSHEEIKSIVCSPLLNWNPQLSQIKCTDNCKPNFISDGRCDEVNNNEECGFDGGDCCDPYASENSSSCGDKVKAPGDGSGLERL